MKKMNLLVLLIQIIQVFGDKWYDYSWLLWSLNYNLKTDEYNRVLLDKLGIEFEENKYNEYIPKEYRGEK